MIGRVEKAHLHQQGHDNRQFQPCQRLRVLLKIDAFNHPHSIKLEMTTRFEAFLPETDNPVLREKADHRSNIKSKDCMIFKRT